MQLWYKNKIFYKFYYASLCLSNRVLVMQPLKTPKVIMKPKDNVVNIAGAYIAIDDLWP